MCLGVTAFTVLSQPGLRQLNICRAACFCDTSVTQKPILDCPVYPEHRRLVCPPKAVAPAGHTIGNWIEKKPFCTHRKAHRYSEPRQHLRGTGLEMSPGILTPPCTRGERPVLSRMLPSHGPWCLPEKLHSWKTQQHLAQTSSGLPWPCFSLQKISQAQLPLTYRPLTTTPWACPSTQSSCAEASPPQYWGALRSELWEVIRVKWGHRVGPHSGTGNHKRTELSPAHTKAM